LWRNFVEHKEMCRPQLEGVRHAIRCRLPKKISLGFNSADFAETERGSRFDGVFDIDDFKSSATETPGRIAKVIAFAHPLAFLF